MRYRWTMAFGITLLLACVIVGGARVAREGREERLAPSVAVQAAMELVRDWLSPRILGSGIHSDRLPPDFPEVTHRLLNEGYFGVTSPITITMLSDRSVLAMSKQLPGSTRRVMARWQYVGGGVEVPPRTDAPFLVLVLAHAYAPEILGRHQDVLLYVRSDGSGGIAAGVDILTITVEEDALRTAAGLPPIDWTSLWGRLRPGPSSEGVYLQRSSSPLEILQP